MRVKYLAQEHNAVPRRGLEPGPPDPESSALTIRSPRLPSITFTIFLFITILGFDIILLIPAVCRGVLHVNLVNDPAQPCLVVGTSDWFAGCHGFNSHWGSRIFY